MIDIPGLGVVERLGSDIVELSSHPALKIYSTLPVQVGAEAFWDPELFAYPSGRDGGVGGSSIDLTGRPRALVYGPYVELPLGLWKAEIKFTIEHGGAPIHLQFDWGTDSDFTVFSTTISRSGSYSLALFKQWLEQGPAQVRVWVMQGVFDGHIDFCGCRVSLVADS